ncbi:MAG: RdgB/HAM1 family non-canonical purine NTP pyrophosphatase [Thiovulaceae bacterium]|nr:RdgB/HAM1 family non-canonical purine NTP pyrophosphatase [Sulfurimonadaceae bacterium]
MKLYLATSNKGKVKEIQALLKHYEVIPYSDIIKPFEIVEDADTFKGNAILKAQAVFEAIGDENALVLADDSGISVDCLSGEPGIYSARYAGEDASDKDNMNKLIENIKATGAQTSKAHYTAAIALTSRYGTDVVHGWMHGTVCVTPKGTGGFGYDPIFIPDGYDLTLGELSVEIKAKLSHRSKALHLIEKLLRGQGFI